MATPLLVIKLVWEIFRAKSCSKHLFFHMGNNNKAAGDNFLQNILFFHMGKSSKAAGDNFLQNISLTFYFASLSEKTCFGINAKRLFRVNYATFSALGYYFAKWHIKIYNAKYIPQVKPEYVRKLNYLTRMKTHKPTDHINSILSKSYCEVYRKSHTVQCYY